MRGDVSGASVGALAHLNRGVFPFFKIWTLYPAVFGQAIPSAFGRFRVADSVGASEFLYNDRRRFEAFINRSSTHIGYGNSVRFKHFELMQHLKEDEADLLNAGLDKIAVLNDRSIQDVVTAIPEELMSDLRKNIVSELLMARRNRMVEMR